MERSKDAPPEQWNPGLIRAPRWIRLIPSLSDVAFLTPVLVLFWCTTGVGWLLTDSDTGWHIRVGEWILENRRVPRVDIFSFTKAGEPWFAWEWLSDVFIAIAHHIGGLGGVVLLSLLILGATSVCVYKSTVEQCGYRVISIVLTALAMMSSTIHWLARPHLVTPLFAAAYCALLNRAERRRNYEGLLALPFLGMLWVNLHGGFFVGIVLLLMYGVGAAGEEHLHGRGQSAWLRARKYAGTAIVCGVATLANPYGYRLHLHVMHYLTSSFYLQRVEEFQSINFHSFSAGYFEMMLALAAAAAIWHLHSGRLIHVTLLLVWSHLALFSARNIPIFAVVALPGIGLALREWVEYLSSSGMDGRLGKFCAAVREMEMGLLAITASRKKSCRHFIPCLVVILLAVLLAHPGDRRALRAEFDSREFPANAAGFLSGQRAGAGPRLFASWQWGGYLIYRLWPSIAVFNDGRTDFYGPAFVEEGLRVWDVRPDWAGVLERYRVNAALVPVDSTLATVLRDRSDWQRVYEDGIAVIFQKIDEGQTSNSKQSVSDPGHYETSIE